MPAGHNTGDGIGKPPIERVVSYAPDAEMAAYDMLGPLASRVLDTCAHRLSAADIVEQCQARGLSPRHPTVDAMIARDIAAEIQRALAVTAGLNPCPPLPRP